ncbi:hypothetical protein STAS_19481 [Striga asiatica]|uniref:Uncharacterized protein n=1 Tax=Striga asiatica TaxID=4170 RepID=A0A5A7QCK1_STRAF|nr:hypothetical protein STAS_19481 [Striga asiatica]
MEKETRLGTRFFCSRFLALLRNWRGGGSQLLARGTSLFGSEGFDLWSSMARLSRTRIGFGSAVAGNWSSSTVGARLSPDKANSQPLDMTASSQVLFGPLQSWRSLGLIRRQLVLASSLLAFNSLDTSSSAGPVAHAGNLETPMRFTDDASLKRGGDLGLAT